MKKNQFLKVIFISIAMLFMLAFAVSPANAMWDLSGAPDGEVVNNSHALQEATDTGGRPVIVVKSYYTEPGAVTAGSEFTLFIELKNNGQEDAKDLVLTFSATNFSPMDTGGVLTRGSLPEDGGTHTFKQTFYAAPGLWGYVVEPLSLTVSYVDAVNGTAYTETFNISISLAPVEYVAPTATPTVSVSRPRLLVTQAKTDIEVLQPGSQFELFLDIANLGSETARSVNMVVGGASVPVPDGTSTPGGSYSASGGDFANFSPLGGSNVQSLGDINVGSTFTASQPLIVNVTTVPGAYTLKISLVYLNARGETLVDDQVVTLLVKQVPMVNISFYREPGDLFTFQPNMLPIQIVNVGKKSVILGSMKITASNGMIENNTLQVGFLDTGGYLTQDAMLTPDMAGEVNLTVTVDYVDDFNQPQTITQELTVNVIDMPAPEIIEDPGISNPIDQMPTDETFWQKVVRFFKGLFGLDSSPTKPDMMEGMPMEGEIIPEDGSVQVAPQKGP